MPLSKICTREINERNEQQTTEAEQKQWDEIDALFHRTPRTSFVSFLLEAFEPKIVHGIEVIAFEMIVIQLENHVVVLAAGVRLPLGVRRVLIGIAEATKTCKRTRQDRRTHPVLMKLDQ